MTTNLNIRTEKEIKEKAEKVFAELGLTMTSAINMFLRSAIRENGIQFSLKLDVLNETTKEAIEEGRKKAYDKNEKSFSSIGELKKELDI